MKPWVPVLSVLILINYQVYGLAMMAFGVLGTLSLLEER